MKILLCSIPDGALKASKPLVPRGQASAKPIFPVGILRVLDSVQEHGYTGEIYDINNLRHSDEEIISNFKKINPTVVGLSGPLSHCYPHMKHIANLVRNIFPNVWIIVGGNITGSAHILLNRTETDICVLGDGEIPFLKLLNFFKKYPVKDKAELTELNEIPGLSYLDKNKKVTFTGFAEQLPAHKMGYPNYDVWEDGLEKFGGNKDLVLEVFDTINSIGDLVGLKEERSHRSPEIISLFKKYKSKRIGRIQTSKGCVAKCTFCQRATKGYRSFKAETLEERVIELKKKYNVAVLRVDDENFGSDRKKSYECAKVFKKHDIYWFAEGARASSITYDDLKFYKENNMLAIRYGIETGSSKMLQIMEKKITKEQVYNNISNCGKLGVSTAIEVMMVGMPGETRETVIETAEYAASLRYLVGNDWNTDYPVWAAAIPGTPLYEYSQQIGVIGKTLDDEEEYLIKLANDMEGEGILNYLNKTDSDRKELHFWPYVYRYIGKKAYVDEIIKNNKSIIKILKEIYQQCFKESYKTFKADISKRIKQKYPIKQNIKQFISVTVKFLIAFSTPFLPRKILLYLLKKISDLNYFALEKKYMSSSDKQEYNFFVDSKKINKEFTFTHEKYLSSERKIDNSLRSVVKKNDEIIAQNSSFEEKNLKTIARMQ